MVEVTQTESNVFEQVPYISELMPLSSKLLREIELFDPKTRASHVTNLIEHNLHWASEIEKTVQEHDPSIRFLGPLKREMRALSVLYLNADLKPKPETDIITDLMVYLFAGDEDVKESLLPVTPARANAVTQYLLSSDHLLPCVGMNFAKKSVQSKVRSLFGVAPLDATKPNQYGNEKAGNMPMRSMHGHDGHVYGTLKALRMIAIAARSQPKQVWHSMRQYAPRVFKGVDFESLVADFGPVVGIMEILHELKLDHQPEFAPLLPYINTRLYHERKQQGYGIPFILPDYESSKKVSLTQGKLLHETYVKNMTIPLPPRIQPIRELTKKEADVQKTLSRHESNMMEKVQTYAKWRARRETLRQDELQVKHEQRKHMKDFVRQSMWFMGELRKRAAPEYELEKINGAEAYIAARKLIEQFYSHPHLPAKARTIAKEEYLSEKSYVSKDALTLWFQNAPIAQLFQCMWIPEYGDLVRSMNAKNPEILYSIAKVSVAMLLKDVFQIRDNLPFFYSPDAYPKPIDLDAMRWRYYSPNNPPVQQDALIQSATFEPTPSLLNRAQEIVDGVVREKRTTRVKKIRQGLATMAQLSVVAGVMSGSEAPPSSQRMPMKAEVAMAQTAPISWSEYLEQLWKSKPESNDSPEGYVMLVPKITILPPGIYVESSPNVRPELSAYAQILHAPEDFGVTYYLPQSVAEPSRDVATVIHTDRVHYIHSNVDPLIGVAEDELVLRLPSRPAITNPAGWMIDRVYIKSGEAVEYSTGEIVFTEPKNDLIAVYTKVPMQTPQFQPESSVPYTPEIDGETYLAQRAKLNNDPQIQHIYEDFFVALQGASTRQEQSEIVLQYLSLYNTSILTTRHYELNPKGIITQATALQWIADHPDAGYQCTIAELGTQAFLETLGIKTEQFDVMPVHTFEQLFIGDWDHTTTKVFLPDGRVIIVDNTPPVTAQTPEYDIARLAPRDPTYEELYKSDIQRVAEVVGITFGFSIFMSALIQLHKNRLHLTKRVYTRRKGKPRKTVSLSTDSSVDTDGETEEVITDIQNTLDSSDSGYRLQPAEIEVVTAVAFEITAARNESPKTTHIHNLLEALSEFPDLSIIPSLTEESWAIDALYKTEVETAFDAMAERFGSEKFSPVTNDLNTALMIRSGELLSARDGEAPLSTPYIPKSFHYLHNLVGAYVDLHLSITHQRVEESLGRIERKPGGRVYITDSAIVDKIQLCLDVLQGAPDRDANRMALRLLQKLT